MSREFCFHSESSFTKPECILIVFDNTSFYFFPILNRVIRRRYMLVFPQRALAIIFHQMWMVPQKDASSYIVVMM